MTTLRALSIFLSLLLMPLASHAQGKSASALENSAALAIAQGKDPSSCTYSLLASDLWQEMRLACSDESLNAHKLLALTGDEQRDAAQLIGFCNQVPGFELPDVVQDTNTQISKTFLSLGVVAQFDTKKVHEKVDESWSPLVENLSRALGNEKFLKTGAGMDLVVQQLVDKLCGESSRPWMLNTCGKDYNQQSLLSLRKNLLLDVSALPHLAIERAAQKGGALASKAADPVLEDAKIALRAAVAVLETALGSAHPTELAIRLAQLAPQGTLEINACVLPEQTAPLARAAALALRISHEMRRLVELRGKYVPNQELLEQASAALSELEQVKAWEAQLTEIHAEVAELKTNLETSVDEAREEAAAKLQLLTSKAEELSSQAEALKAKAEATLQLAKSCERGGDECVDAAARLLTGVIQSELQVLGVLEEGADLSPLRQEAIKKLSIALPRLQLIYEDLAAKKRLSPEQLKSLVLNLMTFAEASLELSLDKASPLPPAAKDALLALSVGDARKTLATLTVLVAEQSDIEIPPGVTSAMNKALCATGASSSKEALQCVILGAWTEDFLFDINADVPRLDSGDFSLVGDVLFGYQWDQLGASVRGSINRWNFLTDELFEDGLKGGGEAEFWWASSPSSTYRFEGRGNFQTYGYFSNVASSSSTDSEFINEDSFFMRGTLNVALRIEPKAPWAIGIWAGGGYQHEFYSSLGVYSASESVITNSLNSNDYILQGKLRGQWEFIPRWLVTRARVDASRFGITRNSLTTTISSGGVEPVGIAEDANQTEVYARLFLDAEVARFFGFVPSLNGGFDYTYRSSPTSSALSMVPVLGIGVRRLAY